ncbi:MAG: endolytic transglycosylase MltG [Acidaminococcaceae bacterium]
MMAKKTLPFIAGFILALAVGIYWYNNYSNSNTALATGQKVLVKVTQGMTTADIATLLHKNKLVNTPESFRMEAKFRGLERSLQAGEYELVTGMSNREIVEVLSKGQVRYETFTVPEGYTIVQIAKKLEKEGLGSAEAFKAAAQNYTPYPYMETTNPDVIYKAEGFVYPSTYYLSPGSNEKDILFTMVQEFNSKLTVAIREQAKAENMSIRDLINMAALVEKEAVFPEERPLIAGVFLKRLRIYMPIQSDTTIQYILGEQKEEISIADTKLASPYNTYQHPGLPPGPIASPSMASITAVLNPEPTECLYFVADLQGHHHFTKTYKEHLAKIDEIHGIQ